MKKIIICISLLCLLILSCKQNKAEITKVEPKENVVFENRVLTKKNTLKTFSPEYFDYSNVILKQDINDTIYAKFSNDTFEDCLTINVESGKISQTKTTIRIKNKIDKIIYEHIFQTTELINGYDTETIKNDDEMGNYLINQAKGILKNGILIPKKLSKEDYLNQSLKEEFEDFETFNEIKNSNRVIFFYGLEEENLYYLGFSKDKNKVVTIINCC
jgi:hypothetical protein